MNLAVSLLLLSPALCAESAQLGSMDFFRRASEQLALGHDMQALGDFRKSLAADPEFKPAQYNLAATYLRLGYIDQALESADPSRCLHAKCKEVVTKARAFKDLAGERALEEDEDCQLYSEMLDIAPKSVETLKGRAQCYFSRGRPIDAIRDLTLVVQIDKGDSESAARAAVGSFVLLDQRQQGLQILRRCVGYDDNATSCKKATKQLRQLQKLVENVPPQKIKVSNVIRSTRELLKAYDIPKSASAGDDEGLLVDNIRRQRCEALAERQLYDQAAKICAQVRDVEPDFAPAVLVQAHLEYELGNGNQAFELVSKILREEGGESGSKVKPSIMRLASQLHDEILMERNQPRQPQQQPDKDLYKILDVEPSADKREIKRAYRKLSKTYHPDKYKGGDMDENAVMEKMQEINEAYEILSDDDRRKDYDNQRNGGGFVSGGGGFSGGGFPGHGGFAGQQFGGGGPQGFDFNAFFKQGNFKFAQ